MNHDELTTALAGMDIPAMRRDIGEPPNIVSENLAWLIRNLPINNSTHEKLGEVMKALQQLRTDWWSNK